ncbi:MAG: hypothetical protein BGN88_09430 [Clostridiales bacterium 43-6]|nr:MAG: hypothetical protein BGN88_09430 [Clostridiales bacterium 43-6]
MIIKRLTVNNFFRFYGKSDIEFSCDADKNVTVIRGENGTGKTTMLNAFYWCLYGDVTQPLYIEKIFNELAEKQLKDNETDEASVEIAFKNKNIEYTMKRKLNFMRRGDDVFKIGDEAFTIYYKDDIGNSKEVKDTRNFFDGIIPQNLRGFFFFDGERIDRLSQVDGREEIKKATLDILGLTKLEDLKMFFDKIERELNADQKRFLSTSEQKLSDEYEALCTERDKRLDELGTFKDNMQKAQENLDDISRFLETHNSEIVKGLQSQRELAENHRDALIKQIDEKNATKTRLITKDFKNTLISSCFDHVYDYLESKRQKGELPSDIKTQFIDDLVKSEVCICGRPLCEHTPEYEAVIAKKANAGKTELDDAYHRLTGYIKQQKESPDDFFSKYHTLKSDVFDLEQDKDVTNKRIKQIGKELANSDEADIAEKENLRTTIKGDIEEYRNKISWLNIEIETVNKKIENKNHELEKVSIKGAQAEALKKRRDTVSKLGQLNQEIQSYFIEMTRVNLDKRIKEVFDSMKEKPYRIASLTNDFVLKITNDDTNKDARILSTGEGQIASLAFIGSLVSYARDKMQDKLMSDFSGGDFPIVMDSPFGNLSAGHKGNVAREIGNLASQVIVIVSDEQWSSIVEQNIKPRVNALYKMIDGDFEDQSIAEHTEIRRI